MCFCIIGEWLSHLVQLKRIQIAEEPKRTAHRLPFLFLRGTVFQKLKGRTFNCGVFPSHEQCRSIDIAHSRPFCGRSLDGGPIPAQNAQIFKVGE